MERGRHSEQTKSRCRHLAAKYTIVVTNFLIAIVGLGLIAVGVVVVKEESSLSALDDLSLDPTVFLLAMGPLMVIVGVVGCLGSLRENIILIKIFGWLVVVLLFGLLIGGITVYFNLGKVREGMTAFIISSIVHYQDDNDKHDALDYIQQRFKCCGAVDLTDWEHNAYFNCSSPAQTSCGVPVTCCKVKSNLECGSKTRGFGIFAAQTIYTTGCVTPLMTAFKHHCLFVAGIYLVLGLLEFPNLLLANVLKKSILLLLKQQQNNTYTAGDEVHLQLDTTHNSANRTSHFSEQTSLNATVDQRKYTENCGNGHAVLLLDQS